MVGWLGAAALAGIGLVAQRSRWKQVPYLGAIAAIAVFVKWRFSQNLNNEEREEKPDVGSANDVEIADEKLDGALQQGIPDEESELRIPRSTERILGPGELPNCGAFLIEEKRNVGMPSGIVPGNQIELHLRDGASAELKQSVNKANSKSVIQDCLPCGSDNLERQNRLMDSMVRSMEAEERSGAVSASRQTTNPNTAEELDSHLTGGNLQSTQVVQDVEDLRAVRELSLSPMGDPQVDKNVDTVTELHADTSNAMHFSILSVQNIKPNGIFQADDCCFNREQKASEETTNSPPCTDGGKNLEDEITMPEQVGYRTDEDGECYTPQCMSGVLQVDPTEFGFSSGGSEDWKAVVVDVSNQQAMEQALPIREKVLEADDEHVVQSPSSVNSICMDTKENGNELSNSTRREYAERLRSYDEYLADPELSPTMRSQVLRARASVAMYFDDSDDDQ